MRVPSDFQIPVTAPRSGVLEALGLKIGEVFTAQIVSQNANGSTLLQVGNQQISLNLPQQFPPGTQVQFEVKGSGAKLELTLLAGSVKPGVTAPITQPSQPQVIVSSSILNQSAQPNSAHSSANPVSPAQNSTSGQTAPQASSAYPRPPLTPSPITQAATPNSNAPSPVVPSPAGSGSVVPNFVAPQSTSTPKIAQQTISLPPQLSASLNLAAGQTIAARVVNPTPHGQAQISINGQTVQVNITNLPPPGTPLQGHIVAQNGQLAIAVQTAKPSPTPYPTLQSSVSGAANAQSGANPTQPVQASSNIAQAAIITNMAQPLAPPNLSQIAADAVARQDSLGKLITTITGLNANSTNGLPANIAQLTRQIADAPIRLDTLALNAHALKDAVARSGVFLEAVLARGAPPPSGPQGDMKNMLMLLRNALGNWLDGEPLPQPQGQKPAPPMRGAPPRPEGQTPQNMLPDGASAREAGRHMLAQTESALSRMRLFQISSLPEAGQRGNPVAAQELQFELPLLLGNQAAMAQFQINRDGGTDSDLAQRGWQMVFAVHFNVIGAVGAKISFRARKTSVVIWAENEGTAVVLEEMLPDLVDGLTAQGLELASVRVRHHAPEAPPAHVGGFVNSVS